MKNLEENFSEEIETIKNNQIEILKMNIVGPHSALIQYGAQSHTESKIRKMYKTYRYKKKEELKSSLFVDSMVLYFIWTPPENF